MKTIAVTMGDPLGIGPEIVVRTLADPRIDTFCTPINKEAVRLAAKYAY